MAQIEKNEKRETILYKKQSISDQANDHALPSKNLLHACVCVYMNVCVYVNVGVCACVCVLCIITS